MAEVNATSAAPPLGDQETSAPERDEEEETVQLSKDDMFHVLQNERRRRVLEFVSDCDGAVEMRDVAEQVAAWEHNTTVRALTSDERQRVYIALYQSHLPKLDDVGLIDYNQSRGIVEPLEAVEQVEPYLFTEGQESTEADAPEPSGPATADDATNEWQGGPVPFRTALAASLLLLGATVAGLTASVGVPAVAVAAVITGIFTLSGLDVGADD